MFLSPCDALTRKNQETKDYKKRRKIVSTFLLFLFVANVRVDGRKSLKCEWGNSNCTSKTFGLRGKSEDERGNKQGGIRIFFYVKKLSEFIICMV